MHGSGKSGACHWSFGGNVPIAWVAYRELITPRLGSSAGRAKRRRRVGLSGKSLGRLDSNRIRTRKRIEPDHPHEQPTLFKTDLFSCL